MNKSKETTLRSNYQSRLTKFIPQLSANPTVEELDEWIIALGGRELTSNEAQEWNQKVHWTQVPGEKTPLGV